MTKIIAAGGHTENDLLAAAASAEQQSEHPLASAIVAAARERKVSLENVEEFSSTTGGGVIAKKGGAQIVVGQPAFLRANGISGLEDLEAQARDLQAEGQTVIFVAINGSAAGIIAISDPIKQSTPGAIQELKRLGLKVIMLTGDNERTAAGRREETWNRSGRSGRRAEGQV